MQISDIKPNPETGEVMHAIQAHHLRLQHKFKTWQAPTGKQLKYVYLIDRACKLAVPEIPYSKIDEIGAGMYRGKKIPVQDRHKIRGDSISLEMRPADQPGDGARYDLAAQNLHTIG